MLHSYLLLSAIALLVNSIGYLFQLKSPSEAAYITALQMSYAGRVWYGLLLFLFVAELCRVKIPEFIKYALVSIHAMVYAAILSIRHNHLYYSEMTFNTDGIFPVFTHGNGIAHHIFTLLQVSYIVIGVFWMLRTLEKEKRKNSSERIKSVLIAVLTEGTFYFMGIIGAQIHAITIYYDITMMGFFIGNTFILVAIISNDLLGTRELAWEYTVNNVISESIIVMNDSGEVQYFNEPAKKLFPFMEQGKECLPRELKAAAAEKDIITINDRKYSPETSELIYQGNYYGRLYVLVDVTEHIKYTEELQKQRDIADRANEAKSRFLANMSHEIRTPINAIIGMDEMIMRESKESVIRNYAADIMSAGKTLLSLINDILDFSKVEEGKMEIVPVHYELSSLLNDLSNMIKDQAAKKGIRFIIDAQSSIPNFLIGDEIRLRQCILNILTNAVKYTEKGTVTLKVSCLKPGGDRILLCISIADTGIGIREEDMENLFTPYERLELKRNRTIEGTGLGMSIVRNLLHLMGSTLKVESEYGKGSVFSFEVDQGVVSWDEMGDITGRLNEADKAVTDYHALFRAPEARILVVDDTEMNLTVIKSLLKKTEVRIDTALSGKDAVTLTDSNVYDVLFIDHMMPVMDGLETLKKIRSSGKNTKTPAVALTANAVSGARQMYLDAGFTAYLSKPVDGVRLEKLLKKLIPNEKLEEPDNEAETTGSGERIRSVILVVDDDSTVCSLIKSIMEPLYEVRECLLAAEALKTAKECRPDLIMLDIHLSDGSAFTVMERIREVEELSDIPILLITGDNDSALEESAFKSGASDYIRKPFVPDILKARSERIIALHHYQRSIEREVEKQTRKSRRLSREMMLTLSKTVDTKDHYTDGHSRRVAAISAEIGRRMGYESEEQVELFEIGLLHDIGKIGVHEDIIHKKTRLTDDEYLEIKEHTVKGYEILKEISDMPRLREGARWHHEHFDGTGYPDGLKGEEIPESARIVCVADCYDAMTSTRTYSVPRKQEEVRSEIERCRGTYFDPDIADIFLKMMNEDRDYRMDEKAEPKDVWKEYERLWEKANRSEIEDGLPGDASKEREAGLLPEWLKETGELDTDSGLKNCGSAEGYLSVLTVFHQTAEAKAEEISTLFTEGDIENYTVKVHALKSSARIIGAGELSKLAEELEMAGKEGNTSFIKDNTKKLLSMYRSLDKELSPLDEKDEELPPIEEGAMKEAYRTMVEIARSMDYALMEELLKSVKEFSLPPSDRERIRMIEGLLNALDWDGIEKIAENAAL